MTDKFLTYYARDPVNEHAFVYVAGDSCTFDTLNAKTYQYASSGYIWNFKNGHPQFTDLAATKRFTPITAWTFVYTSHTCDASAHAEVTKYSSAKTPLILWKDGVPTMPNLRGGDNYSVVKNRASVNRSIESDRHRTYYIQANLSRATVTKLWVSDFASTRIGEKRLKRTNLSSSKWCEYVCDLQHPPFLITDSSKKDFEALVSLRLNIADEGIANNHVKLAVLKKRMHGEIDESTETYTFTTYIPELNGDATTTYKRRRI